LGTSSRGTIILLHPQVATGKIDAVARHMSFSEITC